MTLPVDTLLQGGKYRIVRFISSGGFGCTYEAIHVNMEERVAIKEFFVKDFCNRDETTAHITVGTVGKRALVDKLRRKFADEARALYKLKHPGIVRVSDVFEENGTAYYVMDYVDGLSLGEIVKRDGAMPEVRAVRYIRQVAEALRYVHNHNRLHLDIKPGNIMVDADDNAVLIDFGASKQYDEEAGENTSTLMGKTPGYAPLEQMGNNVMKFMPATDIYALGATLYKLLTGVTPPEANLLASGEELDPLPETISEPTRRAISAAMQIRKNDRPQTIDAFLSLLDTSATSAVELDKTVINDEVTVLADSFMSQRMYNGHDYVDLGLSVKWATCNVGASSPSDYGNYYAWGEMAVKLKYNDENSTAYNQTIGDIAGNPKYDAARANWGGSWRMPTKAEMQELIDKCTWIWTSQEGRNGYRVTSKINCNSIFIPAAGYKYGSSLNVSGKCGYYWCSMPYEKSIQSSCYLSFHSGIHYVSWSYRYYGQSVRPVSE
ncbi:MAG: protein kinase [Alistipes sp.]|nr:protein kinase [Alistipes sp.]MBP3456418.1 protein kinase [Alistipes sp.]